MADAFDEVEENLRQERMAKLFKQGAPIAIAAFVAIVLGVGGYEAWRHFKTQADGAYVEELAQAQALQAGGDLDGAAARFEALAAKSSGAHKAMAVMRQAAALAQKGDLEAAQTAFEAAAAASKDPLLRDSALLRAAYIAADGEEFSALKTRLAPLIEAGGLAQFPARELLAVEALEAGDVETARAEFTFLTQSFDAPQGVKRRAEIGLSMLPPAPKPDAAAAPAESVQNPPAGAEPAP